MKNEKGRGKSVVVLLEGLKHCKAFWSRAGGYHSD